MDLIFTIHIPIYEQLICTYVSNPMYVTSQHKQQWVEVYGGNPFFPLYVLPQNPLALLGCQLMVAEGFVICWQKYLYMSHILIFGNNTQYYFCSSNTAIKPQASLSVLMVQWWGLCLNKGLLFLIEYI